MCRVLIVSDIFGRSDGVQCLRADLTEAGANICLVDPYAGVFQRFDSEEQAYKAFLAQCGHDAYAKQVENALRQQYDMAIGFSAGAAALWRAVASITPSCLKQLVLFYPGQLHHHLQTIPEVATDIIFGESEYHFSVDEIVEQLSANSRVNAVKTAWQHGFMNPASAAFSDHAYQRYVLQLQTMMIALSGSDKK